MRMGRLYIGGLVFAMLFAVFACGKVYAATPESRSKAEQMAAHQDSVAKARMRALVLSQLADKEDDVRSLCSGVNKCLGIRYDFCTEADLKPWPKVKYNDDYCGVYREIVKRGFPADLRQPMATEIFARIGRPYRAIYVNKGTLPLGADVISYLFDNMPFTAELINAYLGTNYQRIVPGKSLGLGTCSSGMDMRRSCAGLCTVLRLPSWTWTKFPRKNLGIN